MAKSRTSLKVPATSITLPKEWDASELQTAGAQGINRKMRITTLTNPPHPLFARDRWPSATNQEYLILLPSIRLASLFLETSMPYLTSFLPSSPVHSALKSALSNIESEEDTQGLYDAFCITPNPEFEVTDEDVRVVREELSDISRYVTWEINHKIFRQYSWTGITRLAPTSSGPAPWSPLTEDEISLSDDLALSAGCVRRPLTIEIMSQYITALQAYPADSELHLRAVFMAACTMAHEIGHVVWAQDYQSTEYETLGVEPFVGRDAGAELGCAMMSRLFGGYDPNFRDKSTEMFEKNLVWTKSAQISDSHDVPLYATEHSVALSYMEDILDQNVWSSIASSSSVKSFAAAARRRFTPNLANVAMAQRPEWTLSKWSGYTEAVWTNSVLARRGPLPRNEFLVVSVQEKEWMRRKMDVIGLSDDEEEGYFGRRGGLKIMTGRFSTQWDGFGDDGGEDEELSSVDEFYLACVDMIQPPVTPNLDAMEIEYEFSQDDDDDDEDVCSISGPEMPCIDTIQVPMTPPQAEAQEKISSIFKGNLYDDSRDNEEQEDNSSVDESGLACIDMIQVPRTPPQDQMVKGHNVSQDTKGDDSWSVAETEFVYIGSAIPCVDMIQPPTMPSEDEIGSRYEDYQDSEEEVESRGDSGSSEEYIDLAQSPRTSSHDGLSSKTLSVDGEYAKHLIDDREINYSSASAGSRTSRIDLTQFPPTPPSSQRTQRQTLSTHQCQMGMTSSQSPARQDLMSPLHSKVGRILTGEGNREDKNYSPIKRPRFAAYDDEDEEY